MATAFNALTLLRFGCALYALVFFTGFWWCSMLSFAPDLVDAAH